MTESTKHPTEKVTFKPGEKLFSEGEPSLELFIIQEGQVEIYKMNHSNQQISLGHVAKGEFLGEISFLLDKRHSANAVAVTTVHAIKITKASLAVQMIDIPTWLLALAKGLAIKLDHCNESLRKSTHT